MLDEHAPLNAQRSVSGRISQSSRDQLVHHVDHFGHLLSEQGPMSVTFVHNNTLLGLQNHHFEEAIDIAGKFNGGRGYLENSVYRGHFASGRITNEEIDQVMARRKDMVLETVLAKAGRSITSGEVLKLHLIHGISAIPATDLRYAAVEGATSRLRDDLPATQRAAVLKRATEDLATAKSRIGKEMTLAGWLQSLLGLDLLAQIRLSMLNDLASETRTAEASLAALRAMGIPGKLWDGYKAQAARLLGVLPFASNADRALSFWLAAEARIVAFVTRRLLDVDGNYDALFGHFSANPASYAARGLWAASLHQFGLEDPFSRVDPASFQERDARTANAEELADKFAYMERWGGPSVPLDSDLRREIADRLQTALSSLNGADSNDAATVQKAHLCWIVLHDLGETRLNRRGYDALRALLSLEQPDDGSAILDRLTLSDPRAAMRAHTEAELVVDIASLHSGKSHVDLIQKLTGEDLSERINEYMIGLCAAFLDEGLAAWHLPGRVLGFYESWRNLVVHDRTFNFDGIDNWRNEVLNLPIIPVDAVIEQLQMLGLPESAWGDYCGRLLVNLKGWAGMVFWRQLHPTYSKQKAFPIDLMQYLAVRLFYQNLLVARACRETWKMRPGVDDLAQYFGSNLSEYMVRKMLYSNELPDHLAADARALAESGKGRERADRWESLADRAWLIHDSEEAMQAAGENAWRLFHLAQLLGLSEADVAALKQTEVKALVSALNDFPESSHGPVWLLAFEKHYRDEVLNVLALNRGRGRWMTRTRRPKAQVVFCIDEREESIHRAFDELDPEYETFGAAGFFGVAMNYAGLDDHHVTPLCPAVVTPVHRVQEVARPVDVQLKLPAHKRRVKWLEVFHDTFWEMKRNPISSYFLIDFAGFLTAYPLIGRTFFPVKYFAAANSVHGNFVPKVETVLDVTRPDDVAVGDGIGFTLAEQADRSEALLRNLGLISNFAPIVVVCGHGSNSQNNPHENAHDCGACGGKHGAPNARAVAAMINNPRVRSILRERGIIVPDDTWFVGAVHNTASESFTFFDTQDLPGPLKTQYAKIEADLERAKLLAARERCRRFASSPKDASPEASYQHVMGRAFDYSQVRPEWGHATNACAVVGRRGITQGAFMDRRSFIISYDPNTDPSGKVLERILLAVGPVGAGINLEYYFSTVDPKVYGSDTKVPHNVNGLVGVMEGAHSDLRTGLPTQMTEVHEAMRLNLIVDAPMAVLGEIYGRQPGIQQLLNGEWVILIAHDPATGEFNQFVPGVGFEKWDDSKLQPLPTVPNSYAWYKGKYERFLAPALIEQPKALGKN